MQQHRLEYEPKAWLDYVTQRNLSSTCGWEKSSLVIPSAEKRDLFGYGVFFSRQMLETSFPYNKTIIKIGIFGITTNWTTTKKTWGNTWDYSRSVCMLKEREADAERAGSKNENMGGIKTGGDTRAEKARATIMAAAIEVTTKAAAPTVVSSIKAEAGRVIENSFGAQTTAGKIVVTFKSSSSE